MCVFDLLVKANCVESVAEAVRVPNIRYLKCSDVCTVATKGQIMEELSNGHDVHCARYGNGAMSTNAVIGGYASGREEKREREKEMKLLPLVW